MNLYSIGNFDQVIIIKYISEITLLNLILCNFQHCDLMENFDKVIKLHFGQSVIRYSDPLSANVTQPGIVSDLRNVSCFDLTE
jgi:hypothetical protein